MKLKKLTVVLTLGVLLVSLTNTAQAQSEPWKFQLAPLWFWAANIQGTSTIGTLPPVPLDLDFQDDVLENLDSVFTIHFEGQQGDWGFLTEYTHVGLDIPLGPIDIDFVVDIAELGVTRRVNDRFEVLGGARYTSMDIDLVTTPVLADESWWDVFVGGRVNVPLNERWTFVARADIGAGDSDLVWNVVAHADYRFNEKYTGFIGYRILDYDFETGSGTSTFAFDGAIEGIIAALVINWGGTR